jgi:hypothetical protein
MRTQRRQRSEQAPFEDPVEFANGLWLCTFCARMAWEAPHRGLLIAKEG